jgi:hypothetical protein
MVQCHLKKDWTRNVFLILFWSINNNYDLLLNKEKRQAIIQRRGYQSQTVEPKRKTF